MPSAQHTACTIEMTNLVKRVDVAVIDEIQVGSAAHRALSHLQWLGNSLLITQA